LAEVEAVDVPGIRQVELSEAGRVCTLRVDGSVECFGPALEGFSEFVDIPDKAFDSLSVDLSFACGLVDGSGSAECFGISDPPFSILVGPAPPNIGRLSAVEAGRLAHCGLGLDGQLRCWGSDRSPVFFAPEGTFESLAVGNSTACALTADGQLSCWGRGEVDDLPEGLPAVKLVDAFLSVACAVTMDDRVACWGTGVDDLGEEPPEDIRWRP